ncbi:MAG: hypothetical protein QM739_06315 [Propionivibrio sp.]
MSINPDSALGPGKLDGTIDRAREKPAPAVNRLRAGTLLRR